MPPAPAGSRSSSTQASRGAWSGRLRARVRASEQDAPPAVEFDRVSFAFDEHVILRGVSFTVPQGSMTVLLGESGVGKSFTLMLPWNASRPSS